MSSKCFYCTGTEGPWHEDHVVPISRGGTSLPRNLVLACMRCNLEKADRLPSEWRPDLPDRVYKLEVQLVEWHEDVDARARDRSFSISVGMFIVMNDQPWRVEAADGRGVWLACAADDAKMQTCVHEWVPWSVMTRQTRLVSTDLVALREAMRAARTTRRRKLAFEFGQDDDLPDSGTRS